MFDGAGTRNQCTGRSLAFGLPSRQLQQRCQIAARRYWRRLRPWRWCAAHSQLHRASCTCAGCRGRSTARSDRRAARASPAPRSKPARARPLLRCCCRCFRCCCCTCPDPCPRSRQGGHTSPSEPSGAAPSQAPAFAGTAAALLQKQRLCFQLFPVFFPSLSWQMFEFLHLKRRKKNVISVPARHASFAATSTSAAVAPGRCVRTSSLDLFA